MKAKNLPFSYVKRKKKYLQWKQFKICFFQSIIYADGELPKEVRKAISIFVALSLQLAPALCVAATGR